MGDRHEFSDQLSLLFLTEFENLSQTAIFRSLHPPMLTYLINGIPSKRKSYLTLNVEKLSESESE